MRWCISYYWQQLNAHFAVNISLNNCYSNEVHRLEQEDNITVMELPGTEELGRSKCLCKWFALARIESDADD